jgi:hypothetical protein
MYTKAKDLPTVPFPEDTQEFKYDTRDYLSGERVHLFEDVSCSGYALDILTDSGLLVNSRELIICQTKYYTERMIGMGKRYLGTGIVHGKRA